MPALAVHAEELAATMRAADAAELHATGCEPLPAIRESMEHSPGSEALVVNGRTAAVFGVRPIGFRPDAGIAWLLTSNLVTRHPKAFMRASWTVLGGMLLSYGLLVNIVDARYGAALRWARRLGFQVEPAAPLGPEGQPFHRIAITPEAFANARARRFGTREA